MAEPGASTIRHQHGGAAWDIPVDLLEIQRRFDEADAECTRLAESDDQDAYQAAQARCLRAALELHDHPWLIDQMAHGRGAAPSRHGA